MSDRRCILFLMLVCCSIGSADPFAPALPTWDEAAPVAPVPDYRVLGIVTSKSRKVAVIRVSDARVRVVSPGERIGNMTVKRITSDAVYLDTGSELLHLPIVNQ